jgi:hypothetical protein
MKDSVLQRILANTFTKSDFYRAIDLVHEFLEYAFYNTDDSDDTDHTERLVAFATKRGEVTSARRIEEWGEEVLGVFTRDNLYEKLREIKEAVEELPELTLYVPVAFGQEELSMIGTWCRENVDRAIILSVSVDSDVSGGCAFVWRGAYHNYSLDHFLNKKQDEIRSVIHAFNG